MFQARQGDVYIVRRDQIPSTAKKVKDCILAHGEATGHRHEIETGAIMWVDTDGTKYIEVTGESATVRHPEHGPIQLDGPSIYRVIQQVEYTPEEIRNVTD